MNSIERTIGLFSDGSLYAVHIERVLIGMRCAVELSNGATVPTNAGILFFGHSPQEHIPQSEVVCVLFRETTGASRYADWAEHFYS